MMEAKMQFGHCRLKWIPQNYENRSKSTVVVGWPELRSDVPIVIREYVTCREEFFLHNSVLFKSQQIIIPKALRLGIITRSYPSHLGIEASLRKARDIAFWLGMNSNMKHAVTH